MGEGNFRPPTESLTDHQKIVASDYVRDPNGCAKFGANPSTAGFWPNGWNVTKFLFIYLYLFSGTHLQVRPVDGFSRLMAQTTPTRARMCLLGVSLTLLPISWVKSPPPKKNNFWVVNRRFQAKQIQYWKFHIIETTASISTKFCTTETIKRSSWVVPIRAINPRWRTVMKFGTVTVMHITADRPLKI